MADNSHSISHRRITLLHRARINRLPEAKHADIGIATHTTTRIDILIHACMHRDSAHHDSTSHTATEQQQHAVATSTRTTHDGDDNNNIPCDSTYMQHTCTRDSTMQHTMQHQRTCTIQCHVITVVTTNDCEQGRDYAHHDSMKE